MITYHPSFLVQAGSLEPKLGACRLGESFPDFRAIPRFICIKEGGWIRSSHVGVPVGNASVGELRPKTKKDCGPVRREGGEAEEEEE